MMTNKHPTICAKCAHMVSGIPAAPDIPHCKVNPDVNYVTGAMELLVCVLKNYGDCADYEAAPVPPDPQADEAYGSSESDEQGNDKKKGHWGSPIIVKDPDEEAS